ncbi:nuclear transport factor 2 family protein [Streptomyces sp. NBC_01476]|uniref:nuclear transport factor 2 family protein n=1 Tax=Streptomyces sp. NBC_01476 TaxID=2903881 RepID=UPI002E2FF947|nr:nuclear transport factor 2 family protein [Streptomyces sp. NBC_01476]
MHSFRPATGPAHLLHRYLIGLDDEKLDDAWASTLFTEDAVVAFPMSRHSGIEGLAAYHRDSLSAFRSTQHLAGPAVVDPLGDDLVRLRANLISTHVHHGPPQTPLFVTGTFVTGEARRLPDDQWRLASLAFHVVWMTGSPPSTQETAS